MSKAARHAIQPTRTTDYPEWYQQVIRAADLAEHSPVRGCMVIKPRGYALWERMQALLDQKFKDTGHENAYFPLLIPLAYLTQEATHIAGFAKECAVVTHHRLAADAEGQLQPAGALEEPYVIRPTSETVIGMQYAKWIQSHRDLPLKINQWANVMRWEMRTRLFLRTSEFLWQEGHTAHATAAEAIAETRLMLDVYAEFLEQVLAIPVIKGEKTADERFPGAVNTYTVETLMQDGKALQAGTAHFLGQNFAKSFNIQFTDEMAQRQYCWTTSWGVSTRLIGALIMAHGDDDGLVLPPKIAPRQVVLLPIIRDDNTKAEVLAFTAALAAQLKEHYYAGERIRVVVDDRQIRGGEKTWQHIKAGVPLRVEIGPRDVANNSVCLARRDDETHGKKTYSCPAFVAALPTILGEIQQAIWQRAYALRQARTCRVTSVDEFIAFFNQGGGFARCLSNHPIAEQRFKALLAQLKVSARCIPLAAEETPVQAGHCIFSGAACQQEIIYATAY